MNRLSTPVARCPKLLPAGGVTTAQDTFGPACGSLPQGNQPGSLNSMGPQPVATAASSNPLLTTLVQAVNAVPGLPDTLNGAPSLTVFAPSNEAFTAVQQQLVRSGSTHCWPTRRRWAPS